MCTDRGIPENTAIMTLRIEGKASFKAKKVFSEAVGLSGPLVGEASVARVAESSWFPPSLVNHQHSGHIVRTDLARPHGGPTQS